MIDWQKYNDTFQWYGKDVEIELIGILQDEYSDRMAKIAQNVADRDFEQLKFNTHSLKGTIANYQAPEPVELAKELEVMAKEGISEGIDELFVRLQESTNKLMTELLEHRQALLDEKG